MPAWEPQSAVVGPDGVVRDQYGNVQPSAGGGGRPLEEASVQRRSDGKYRDQYGTEWIPPNAQAAAGLDDAVRYYNDSSSLPPGFTLGETGLQGDQQIIDASGNIWAATPGGITPGSQSVIGPGGLPYTKKSEADAWGKENNKGWQNDILPMAVIGATAAGVGAYSAGLGGVGAGGASASAGGFGAEGLGLNLAEWGAGEAGMSASGFGGSGAGIGSSGGWDWSSGLNGDGSVFGDPASTGGGWDYSSGFNGDGSVFGDPASTTGGLPPGLQEAATQAVKSGGSALKSLAEMTGISEGILQMLGTGLQTGLGVYSALSAGDAAKDAATTSAASQNALADKVLGQQNALYDKTVGFGEADRARYQESYAPGFDIWAQGDAYKNALDTSWAAGLNKASASAGNPIENPGVMGDLNKNIMGSLGLPALSDYRQRTSAVGYGSINPAAGLSSSALGQYSSLSNSAIGTSAGGDASDIASQLAAWKAGASGLESLLNPKQPKINLDWSKLGLA